MMMEMGVEERMRGGVSDVTDEARWRRRCEADITTTTPHDSATTRWVAYEYEYKYDGYDQTGVRMEGVSFIFTASVKGWRRYSESISGVGGYDMLDSDGMDRRSI